MNLQAYGIASICAGHDIRQVVICPGSRSAPLVLAFTENKQFRCYTFSDERSAAFQALGMAQQTGRPVVLICTSGSAAYNFAPAIVEAYYQQTPLILLTADRPAEWIDQLDGQTIRQKEIYGTHVKKYFEIPQDYSHPDNHWHANRIVNEAILLSQNSGPGPVHINIPMREPLYARPESLPSSWARIIKEVSTANALSENNLTGLAKSLGSFERILIVAGQQPADPTIVDALRETKLPVAGDILSNLHALPHFCRHADTFLGAMKENVKKEFAPDLLITFGKSLVAKNLKLLLRSYRPKEHWHITCHSDKADTFQALTKIICAEPSYVLTRLASQATTAQVAFGQRWRSAEAQAAKVIDHHFQSADPGEFAAVYHTIRSLPASAHLHLANSMSVRYANHIGLTSEQRDISVFSNRGTSGIDGCTSTAMGHSLVATVPQVLLTGDQAFFYDRNAFWHNYPVENLMTVVLNNHGGIIFNLIDGPAGLPQAEEFFITEQRLNARALAAEFGLNYSTLAPGPLTWKAGIVEIESTQADSRKQFEHFKNFVRKAYES